MRNKVVLTLIALLTLTVSSYAAGNGTYTEICKWNFNWPPNCPTNSLAMDAAGNLYGTAGYGEYDALNELSPNGDGTWTANQIYYFGLYSGYNTSTAALAIDKAGNLYGTAFFGGLGTDQILCYNELGGCGTVYELSPSENGWTETTLYYFQGLNIDGGNPLSGLTLVSPTRLYGTTSDQGAYGYGTVFELNYSKRKGSWTEKQIYNFTQIDGAPTTGALLKGGNLYGATGSEIYELTKSGGEWSSNLLYAPSCSTCAAGIIDITFGKDGNIYGTCGACVSGGDGSGGDGGGQVFELSESNGQWTMTILHVFGGTPDGSGPVGGLAQDKHGNFYGQTSAGGVANSGAIFEMSKSKAGVWTETVLHSFPHENCDTPQGTLFVDKSGNLYGTDTCGNNFELTP
jgi:hypothetical protein